MVEKSTSAQLKSIAQEIRGCRYELSLPEEHAGYIVELVETALALPDAFSSLGCLRREIGRLKRRYPKDWDLRALKAIARAFAPGFKPSSKFMEGGWFTGGWDDVEKIAAAIDREANRVGGLPKDEKPPLTHQQKKAFDLICKEGPLLGKDIVRRLPGIGSAKGRAVQGARSYCNTNVVAAECRFMV